MYMTHNDAEMKNWLDISTFCGGCWVGWKVPPESNIPLIFSINSLYAYPSNMFHNEDHRVASFSPECVGDKGRPMSLVAFMLDEKGTHTYVCVYI
jgi:hypothetical protein